jgi:hypothetical protein
MPWRVVAQVFLLTMDPANLEIFFWFCRATIAGSERRPNPWVAPPGVGQGRDTVKLSAGIAPWRTTCGQRL